MSTSIRQLIDLCNRSYEHCDIVAGHDSIHGANLHAMPSGEVVLCFRGTLANHDFQSALDWMKDAKADLVAADGFPGRVHAGFLDALNALWSDIIDELEGHGPSATPAKPNGWWQRFIDLVGLPQHVLTSTPEPLPWDKKITITGHSKGGALAILAAVRLAALKPRVVTFGAPMVGDAEFNTGYPNGIDLTRYEGERDLVPLLPGLVFGYQESPGVCIPQNKFCQARWWKEIAISKMVAAGGPEQLHVQHSLDTYRSWACKDEPPDAPAARAA